jgi:hypothetical protein
LASDNGIFEEEKKDLKSHATRYVNHFSFLISEGYECKKHDFLNPFFLLQKYHCQKPIKNCSQQHANTVTDKAVTSRKFEQHWSTLPPYINKTNNHLYFKSLNIKRTHHI